MEKYIRFLKENADYYIKNAESEFQKFHIDRKKQHSQRVNSWALEIVKGMNLNDKEIYLINISSLLHDIGRFKQFYDYGTYLDKISINHALLGIQILKEHEVLKDLEEEDVKIILEIIEMHNYKELPEDISEKLYLYSSIIRDADKIDWLYSMVNIIPDLSKENQEVFYSGKKDENFISPEVVKSILNNEKIVRSNLTTVNELRVSALAWITSDIKNKKSIELIKDEKILEKAYKLIEDSHEKNIIFNHIKKYINCD